MPTKVIPGQNDIATVAPELAAELTDQNLATRIAAKSNSPVSWTCRYGHQYTAEPHRRWYSNLKCPHCQMSGYEIRVISVFKDDVNGTPLFTRMTALPPHIEEKRRSKSPAYGIEVQIATIPVPNDIYASHIIDFIANHWSTQMVSGALKTYETPHQFSLAVISLDTLTALVANVSAYLRRALKGTAPATGHTACPLGHPTDAPRPDRFHSRCKICNHKTVAPWFNTIHLTHPWIAKQAKGKLQVNPYHHIYVRGQAIPGYNDLATTHPTIAAELVDSTLATRITAGGGGRVEWSCSNPEHPSWFAYVPNRTYNGTACPMCASETARIGYNASSGIATFYIHAIYRHGQHIAYKYGKTTVTLAGRVRKQQAAAAPGITIKPVYSREESPGIISRLEYAVKRHIKALNIPRALTRAEFEDGYTETIPPTTDIKAIIQYAEEAMCA